MNYALALADGQQIGLSVDSDVYDIINEAENILATLTKVDGLPARLHLGVKANSTAQSPQLQLQWHQQDSLPLQKSMPKPLDFAINYSRQLAAIKSFPTPKQGAFNQALGRRSQTILDATGGWGADAFLMATQGYKVRIQERHPLMALLLTEAFQRLEYEIQHKQLPLFTPDLYFIDSVASAGDDSKTLAQFDCVYLDPMFPPKRKKSAAVNKQMQLLHWLVGEDQDADALVRSVLDRGAKRVAVKRPDYAKPLFRAPDTRFSSKLVHYDVYLR